MDSLPVELVRLIFQYCDYPSVRALRLGSGRLADIGYEYLLPDHFTVVEWRDDVKRLHSIANHDRLRNSIRSISFNFAKIDEYNARHTTFFQHWLQEPEERNNLLQDAWVKYYELEAQGQGLPAFHTRSALIEDAFKKLSSTDRLKSLEITFTKCPYDIEVLRQVYELRNCRKRDRAQACKNMNAIVSAVRHVRLDSLSIDQLPLELFRLADDRRHWFDCARSFASLSKLDLVLDPPDNLFPQSRFKAVNGLGHVLQFSTNLTHLRLAFHTYHAPGEKFELSFNALFRVCFTYEKLTDLKLEGISCSEDDLKCFLLRHAATLERLRLGGRGLAKPYEASIGGVHLYEGSWRSLFAGLQGKLPNLKRFHMEGDVESGDIRTNSREVWDFKPVTDDDWNDIEVGPEGLYNGWRRKPSPHRRCQKIVDSRGLERFLIDGGPWPSEPTTTISLR
ncbi:hypothetical protein QBC38DRAFT_510567 [Podospora fimiseda]|uniref:F-box domain-containing protein n=1 Tax=Podospora fimiseda TaxID=252190 RepID=A0AAN7BNF5_9PEZI|nr:hypothetical protein QBC38DRAFT_510567 [Podospora fimiseda]